MLEEELRGNALNRKFSTGGALDQVGMEGASLRQDEKFVPRGAFAFFILVLTVMAIIWLSVYFIMIKQA